MQRGLQAAICSLLAPLTFTNTHRVTHGAQLSTASSMAHSVDSMPAVTLPSHHSLSTHYIIKEIENVLLGQGVCQKSQDPFQENIFMVMSQGSGKE